MFEIQGGAYFLTDFKWLAHKIWMLESTSKLVGQKMCYIHVYIFPNKNRCSQEKF